MSYLLFILVLLHKALISIGSCPAALEEVNIKESSTIPFSHLKPGISLLQDSWYMSSLIGVYPRGTGIEIAVINDPEVSSRLGNGQFDPNASNGNKSVVSATERDGKLRWRLLVEPIQSKGTKRREAQIKMFQGLNLLIDEKLANLPANGTFLISFKDTRGTYLYYSELLLAPALVSDCEMHYLYSPTKGRDRVFYLDEKLKKIVEIGP